MYEDELERFAESREIRAGEGLDGPVSAIYRRLLRARNRGTGIRLSADDVQTLCIGDNAIETVLTNLEWDDDER